MGDLVDDGKGLGHDEGVRLDSPAVEGPGTVHLGSVVDGFESPEEAWPSCCCCSIPCCPCCCCCSWCARSCYACSVAIGALSHCHANDGEEECLQGQAKCEISKQNIY